MAEEEQRCPKCGAPMVNSDQKMAVESEQIKILLVYGCENCGTTVQCMTSVDRKRTPWVKKTVYRGVSLEFVYSEGEAE
jgi:hypothetical protein